MHAKIHTSCKKILIVGMRLKRKLKRSNRGFIPFVKYSGAGLA